MTAWTDAIRADSRELPAPIVTAWAYKPGGHRIADGQADNSGLSGISPAGPAMAAYELREHGHVILTAGTRPARHHVIGCGPGHDDAQFAEAGSSFAEYLESGRAYGGAWWQGDTRQIGRYLELITAAESSHLACCHVTSCGQCAELTTRVQNMRAMPLVACERCGAMRRELSPGSDGTMICGGCIVAEVFAR